METGTHNINHTHSAALSGRWCVLSSAISDEYALELQLRKSTPPPARL